MLTKERTTTSSILVSSETPTANLPSDARVPEVIVATIASVFALYSAQRFFIPLVLGIILACTLNPLVRFLERLKIPRLFGTTLVMAALLCGLAAATFSLRTQVEKILDQVPDAAAKLSATLRNMANQPNPLLQVQEAARKLEQATNQAANGQTTTQKPPTRVVIEEPKVKLVDWLWTGSL